MMSSSSPSLTSATHTKPTHKTSDYVMEKTETPKSLFESLLIAAAVLAVEAAQHPPRREKSFQRLCFWNRCAAREFFHHCRGRPGTYPEPENSRAAQRSRLSPSHAAPSPRGRWGSPLTPAALDHQNGWKFFSQSTHLVWSTACGVRSHD